MFGAHIATVFFFADTGTALRPTVLYGKILYQIKFGEKQEKSKKSPEKSEKSPEKSARERCADLFFL